MKLQKQLSRKYGDKKYAKYVIVIKPKLIDKLGWKDGEELEAEVKKGKLIIEKD
ncbi:AbrB/MazE/SpoVT family DNA-binding domain-containing protein [Candidatus Woesearchaeota archaeon]|nr:AbrB/MazE/SpoVT family DNA-binding domain-containing protein [Candidatus Woesearchaeota archaeon]